MPSVFQKQKIYSRPTTPRSTFHPKRTEELLQIKASNYVKKNYPEAILIGDFAAGLNLKDSDRIKMMKMRSEDGQPDISIDYASRGYHGLRIELKAEGTVIKKKDGTLRKQPYTRKYKQNGKVFIKKGDHLSEQAATLRKYIKLGYYANFAIGFDDFVKIVDWYFKKPKQESLF